MRHAPHEDQPLVAEADAAGDAQLGVIGRLARLDGDGGAPVGDGARVVDDGEVGRLRIDDDTRRGRVAGARHHVHADGVVVERQGAVGRAERQVLLLLVEAGADAHGVEEGVIDDQIARDLAQPAAVEVGDDAPQVLDDQRRIAVALQVEAALELAARDRAVGVDDGLPAILGAEDAERRGGGEELDVRRRVEQAAVVARVERLAGLDVDDVDADLGLAQLGIAEGGVDLILEPLPALGGRAGRRRDDRGRRQGDLAAVGQLRRLGLRGDGRRLGLRGDGRRLGLRGDGRRLGLRGDRRVFVVGGAPASTGTCAHATPALRLRPRTSDARRGTLEK